MQSIFNLKTSTDELESSNHGVSKDLYEQVTPSRDVTLANFPNGQISFKWQTSGTKWFVPSKTYLRMRVKLSAPDGTTALDRRIDAAPSMDQFATLFQSAEFRINDKTVSRISDYMGPIDALDTRINKSRSWINSVGESSNFWNSYWHVRQSDIAADGEIYDGDGPALIYRDNLGYAGSTYELTAAGVMTFDSGPNTNTVFLQGDQIEIQVAGGILIYYVQGTAASRALQLVGPTNVIGAGAVTGWYLSRPVNAATRAIEYELTWCPPLSIFKVEHALPCGRYELILTPQASSVYQIAAVESTRVALTTATHFKFSVQDMYCYINTVESSRVDNLTYYLDLQQISCQAEAVGNSNFLQKNFDVSPSTQQIAIAFQDDRVNTDTRYSCTRFRSYNNDAYPQNDVTASLNRLFINYAGVSKPSPDADPAFVPAAFMAGQINKTTQRYVESLLASGSYHDTGGSESIEEWARRGPYYLFNWSKDGNDRSTRVSVHHQFANADVNLHARLLLFAISAQVAKIVISNGSVVDVQVEDV